MLDIGWQELLVIGVLALLVVGPKELPGLLRNVGRWAGKARSVARDFQRSMEDAAREADLEEFNRLREVKRDVENMGRLDYKEQAKRAQSYMDAGKPAANPNGAAGGAAPEPPAEAPETAAPAEAPAAEPRDTPKA
jgi:sec-independent protein translocase protein TatB